MRGSPLAVLLGAAVVAACFSRKVQVGNPPPVPAPATAVARPDTGPAINVTNNLSQAVNIYAVNGETEMLLKQVGPNNTVRIPVTSIAPGTSVTLRARTVDGTRTLERPNVVIGGTFDWRLP